MENLEIVVEEGTHFKPAVIMNASNGVCEISGESYIKQASEFYKPINDWLIEYIKNGGPIVFNFKLTYVNTSSSKHLLSILRILKNYKDAGGQVSTNWYIEPGDTDTEEDVEDYSIISGLEIKAIKKK